MRSSSAYMQIIRSFLILISLLIYFNGSLFSQQLIRGQVTNPVGNEIPGVSVLNKTTGKGAISDSTGRFIILADSGATIEISSVGYRSQNNVVTHQTVLNIILSEMITNLDEVVAIGYGTARKKDLTGAMSSVRDGNFNKGNYSSPDFLIQGKVSGVQVMSDNGDPGGYVTVKIRGNSALTGTGQPLYVIDGVQLDGRSLQDGNNALNFLNADDIVSIDVLKDASATAIYGSRAAYGVVIINTKKGQIGAAKLEVSMSAGVSSILKKVPVLNSSQYRAALQYYGVDPSFDKGGNADGLNAILQTGHQQNYFIAASGGTETGKYRFSLGYLNMDGIIINTGYKKVSADVTFTTLLLDSKRLGLDFHINASQYTRDGSQLMYGNGNLIQAALQWNPTDSLRNPDGSVKITPGDNVNPIALSEYARDNLKVTTILGSVSPYYKFTDWLEYKLLVSVNYSTGVSRSYLDDRLDPYQFFYGGLGQATIGNNELTTEQITNTLTFDKNITHDLHLNAVAGYEYVNFSSKGFSLTGNGVPGIGFGNYGLDYTNYVQYSNVTNRAVSSFIDPTSELQSFFARTMFNYKEKYLFTATFRADGSTKFGSNNKYGYFPSFALAWNITKENFFKTDVLNSLKLRASWGKTGNQEFPPGSSQALYAFQNNGSAIQINSPNPDLKWQTDRQYDIGIDFSILNNRISGTVDYFNKNTTNLLFPSPPIQPAPPGSTIRWINLDGSIVNKGIEVLLSGEVVRGRKFSWNLSANVSFLQNNVSGLPVPLQVGGGNILVETIRNGLPMQALYTRKFLGLDKNGFSVYQDDGNTLYYVGNPNPQTLLGITTTFRYGKFSLTANMVGSYGQDIFNNTLNGLLNVTGISGRNIALSVYQDPVKESLANPVTPSSRPIQNGDYFKMSNLTLSYNLGNFASAFKGANIYVTAQNLFIITNYPGFDPEVNVDAGVGTTSVPHLGLDFARYPSSRTFLFGINFSL